MTIRLPLKLLFDFFGEMKDTFYQVRLVTLQQNMPLPGASVPCTTLPFQSVVQSGYDYPYCSVHIPAYPKFLRVDKLFCFG